MSIEVRGGFHLQRLVDAVREAKPEAERAGAEVILEAAKEGVGEGPPRGPNEYQRLKERSSVSSVESGAEVRFPGPYAAYLEERLDLHHPGGGHAKFLEIALVQKKDEALAKAADVLREKLGESS